MISLLVQARQLENQIDVKLVSLSKLGTSFNASDASPASSSDRAPLLSASEDASPASKQDAFRSLAAEIRGLLSRLTVVNDGMAEYASQQPQSAAVHHTLQRHRDILQDYR